MFITYCFGGDACIEEIYFFFGSWANMVVAISNFGMGWFVLCIYHIFGWWGHMHGDERLQWHCELNAIFSFRIFLAPRDLPSTHAVTGSPYMEMCRNLGGVLCASTQMMRSSVSWYVVILLCNLHPHLCLVRTRDSISTTLLSHDNAKPLQTNTTQGSILVLA